MAAGDFSASNLLRAQVRLSEIFRDPNSSDTQFDQPYVVGNTLTTNQTATMSEIMENGNCVGIKAYYMRGNTSEPSAPSDCVTPSGPQAESLSQNYDNTVLVRRAASIQDNRCNNEFEFEEEMARQMRLLIIEMRARFSVLATTRLASWTQVNLDPGIPTWMDDTTESPRILMPDSRANWTSVGEMEATASNNRLGEKFFISGRRGFFQDRWEADFRARNDNERSNLAAYQSAGGWYQDIRNIDATLGYPAVFAVARNNYVFWNTHRSTPTPVMVSDNKWVYTVPDPEWKYVKNGRLVPVVYEFEAAKLCVERGDLDYLRFQWNLYGRLQGGLERAPTGPNGEKAALQWKIV